MTAIAGCWHLNGAPAAADCERMLAAQALYGPSDSASITHGDVALGRRLYRLIPEDRFDRQPLIGGGGRFTLVADLRLDNRDALCRALGIEAAQARSLADSAILLAAWERWEEQCFDRLLGDYAFALWDARDHRLILARDHFGNRPLHYHIGPRCVAFASMPKGLHALPGIPYGPDPVRIAESLVMLPEAGPRSFFAAVSRVEAGCFVSIERGRHQVQRHWQPRGPSGRVDGDPVEAVREHLDRATRARLRGADGNVGSHLSGGYDSAGVTATAARLMAESGGRVTAFTAVPRTGFVDPEPERRIGDEGALARATAAMYPNIDHVLLPIEPGTPLDRLDCDFALFDRPVRNLCNQRWMAQINASARDRGLTVMLTGTNGNMTISHAGMELLAELAGRGRLFALSRASQALVRSGRLSWLGTLDRSLGAWLPEPLWRTIHRLAGHPQTRVSDHSAINPAKLPALSDRARGLGRNFAQMPFRNAFDIRLSQMTAVDMGNYNKGMLAGWGVDYRDPTSDRLLIEYCLSLPTNLFLENGLPRALAAKALADRVPASVLAERRRGMQAVDWFEGMEAARGAIDAEIALARNIPAAADALDLDRMAALVAHWPSGAAWRSSAVVSAYRIALIRGISASHFLRRASEARPD